MTVPPEPALQQALALLPPDHMHGTTCPVPYQCQLPALPRTEWLTWKAFIEDSVPNTRVYWNGTMPMVALRPRHRFRHSHRFH